MLLFQTTAVCNRQTSLQGNGGKRVIKAYGAFCGVWSKVIDTIIVATAIYRFANVADGKDIAGKT